MSVGFPFSQVCDVTYRTSPSASKELKIKRPKDKSLSPLVHDCRPIEKCTKNGLVVFKERLMELERKRAKPKKAEQCSSAEIVTSEFSSSYNLTPKRNRSTATHRGMRCMYRLVRMLCLSSITLDYVTRQKFQLI